MTPQEEANDLFNRALEFFRQERFNEANELLDPLLAIAPDAPPALNLKSVVLSRLGLASQALPYAAQAVTLSPDDPFYCCNLGQVLMGLGHVNEAVSAFDIGFRHFLARSGHGANGEETLLGLAQAAASAPQALAEPSVYFESYLHLLHRQPQAPSLRAKLLEQLKNQDVLGNAPDEATAQESLRYLLDLAGLHFNTPVADNQATMDALALPWLRRALERDWFDLALWLEREIDLRYVHQIETEEHHTRHYRTVAPLMNQAGRRVRDTLPPVAAPSSGQGGKIAFLVHDLHPYDANRVMLDALRGMGDAARNATIIALGDIHPSAYQDFTACGVAIFAPGAGQPHLKGKWYPLLLEARKHLAEQGIGVVLWNTNNAHMSFAFGLRLAPVQIWWSLQYHGIELEDIDGYIGISFHEKFKRIGQRDWRCVHSGVADLFDPGLSSQAQQLRQQFPVKTLLGCMGRVEKLNNPQYLDAVTDILQARPEAGFLWTGQMHLPAAQERFEKAGVANRCFFAGWVNTRLYAQVLDICLDTFPFGGGITVSECMAAGRPVVFRLSPEAMESGVPMVILPLLEGKVGTPERQEQTRKIFTGKDGENLFLLSKNTPEYTAMALRLIDDPDFRQAVGEAGRQFKQTYYMDIEEMARTLLEHIGEIVHAL